MKSLDIRVYVMYQNNHKLHAYKAVYTCSYTELPLLGTINSSVDVWLHSCCNVTVHVFLPMQNSENHPCLGWPDNISERYINTYNVGLLFMCATEFLYYFLTCIISTSCIYVCAVHNNTLVDVA